MVSSLPQRLTLTLRENEILTLCHQNKSILVEMKPANVESFCYVLHVSLRGTVTSKFFSYILNSVESLTKWYNITYTVEIPCIHCYQHKDINPYLFSLEVRFALSMNSCCVPVPC